jgi:D-beta-D-heptose 7-phosphate kinase/D-beta-D-heptose 1-phosphate adenosyltransferase
VTALDREAARRLAGRFAGAKVVVVGDVMLDRFIWGEVERISPEAPVPVVRVSRESVRLGGAANVAANLARLGADVLLVGLVGADAAAAQLRQAADDAGIGWGMVEDPDRITTVKTRIIARAQQVVRVDRENEASMPAAKTEELVSRALAAIRDSRALVISDYDKGAAAEPLLAKVLPAARALAIPVVVDPKVPDFSRYQPITVITPNQHEAARASGLEIRGDDDAVLAARRILEMIDTRAVLITRGERGMLLKERDREPELIPVVAREVYDVTGAGDTVVAAMAMVLAAGGSLREAAVIANLAAGIVVGKVGTATVGPEEILDRFD